MMAARKKTGNLAGIPIVKIQHKPGGQIHEKGIKWPSSDSIETAMRRGRETFCEGKMLDSCHYKPTELKKAFIDGYMECAQKLSWRGAHPNYPLLENCI